VFEREEKQYESKEGDVKKSSAYTYFPNLATEIIGRILMCTYNLLMES
jgi:hypothetical protein